MATVTLSREAFKRGVKDALELRQLRDMAKEFAGRKAAFASGGENARSKKHTIVVVKSHSGWHVKRAS